MAKSRLLPGFIGLGGKSKRVKNLATGEELSRRQYAETVKRQNVGLTNEKLAAINRATDAENSIARPAKGRKSIQKLAPDFKHTVAEVRLQAEKEKAQKAKAEKAQRLIESKIERERNKKIKPPSKITASSLKPGHKGRRYAVNDYSELEILRKSAQKSGKVIFYGAGVHGLDMRSGITLDITVFRMRPIRESIGEAKFYAEIEYVLEEKTYFELLNLWIHLAFNEKTYTERAENAGYKRSKISGKFTKISPNKKGKKKK